MPPHRTASRGRAGKCRGAGRSGRSRTRAMMKGRRTTMPNAVRLHRVIAAPPEKVYRAFLEPDAVASWLPPFGFTCTVHELDARVGGGHRMTFRNFTTDRKSTRLNSSL